MLHRLIPVFAILAAVPAAAQEIDCSAEANQERPECLGLPPAQEATNLVVPLAPALLAGAGMVAAISGGGGTPSTPSTPSTPGTTN